MKDFLGGCNHDNELSEFEALTDKCQDIVYTKMCHNIVYSSTGIRIFSLIPVVAST